MSEEASTAAYTATFKSDKGFEAPWLVIRADTATDLHDKINTARESALMATIGGAAKDFHAAYQFGQKLDARPINPPAEEEAPAKKAPAKKAPAKKAPAKKEEPEAEASEPEEPAEEVEESPVEEEAPAEEAPKKAAPKKPAAATKAPPKAKWKKA